MIGYTYWIGDLIALYCKNTGARATSSPNLLVPLVSAGGCEASLAEFFRQMVSTDSGVLMPVVFTKHRCWLFSHKWFFPASVLSSQHFLIIRQCFIKHYKLMRACRQVGSDM